jgi:hypothetical protein
MRKYLKVKAYLFNYIKISSLLVLPVESWNFQTRVADRLSRDLIT